MVTHHVVIKDGRVFDQWTALNGLKGGMDIDEYKTLWDHPDAVDFGF